MASNDSKKLQIVVICMAIGIVLASIISTLVVTKTLSGSDGSQQYQNVTFTDAVLTCESQIERIYDKNISLFYLDNHSSRYDTKSFQYKLFFNLNLKGAKKVSVNYVNCFVRAATGKVTKLEVMEEVDRPDVNSPAPTTNAFGWPK